MTPPPKPRVLFITDDRESYASGNYYLAYQRAFIRACTVELVHPSDPWPDLDQFDLVVIGHATIEHFPLLRGERRLPERVRPWLWLRKASLRALRATRTKKLLFTKNDYKYFDVKNSFIEFVRPDWVITHTRQALSRLRAPHRLSWLPFGVDAQQFQPPGGERDPLARPYLVGFRANANSDWNGGERVRLFRALERLRNERSVSLTLSKDGEGFLVGQPYVDWMRSCTLLGNSVSAEGTVGPRFLEAMACGTLVLAPRNPYEGLLVPDVHYIPLEAGDAQSFPGIEPAIARFLEDAAYREQLYLGARTLVAEHNVDQHVLQVCRELGVLDA